MRWSRINILDKAQPFSLTIPLDQLPYLYLVLLITIKVLAYYSHSLRNYLIMVGTIDDRGIRPFTSNDALAIWWICELAKVHGKSFKDIASAMPYEYRDPEKCALTYQRAIATHSSHKCPGHQFTWRETDLKALERACTDEKLGFDWLYVPELLPGEYHTPFDCCIRWRMFQKPAMEARLRDGSNQGQATAVESSETTARTHAITNTTDVKLVSVSQMSRTDAAAPALLSESQVKVLLQMADEREKDEKQLKQRELDAAKKESDAKEALATAAKSQADAEKKVEAAKKVQEEAKALMSKAKKLQTEVQKQEKEMDAAKVENDRKRRAEEEEGDRVYNLLVPKKRLKIEGRSAGVKTESAKEVGG